MPPLRVLRYNFPITLDTNTEFIINMPIGAQIIKVGIKPSADNVSIWALVDTAVKKDEKRKFLILGTGYEYGNGLYPKMSQLKFLNTIFEDNIYVWHIFEIVG